MGKMTRWLIAAIALAVVLVSMAIFSTQFRAGIISHGSTQETRGYEIAKKQGCFHCHGEWGMGGVANPGAKKIPALADFSFLMSIDSEAELREWIRLGAPANSHETVVQRSSRAVTMPAYGRVLNERELDALVSFYHAISGTIWPKDAMAEQGYKTAQRLGCFSCHGPGGRIDMPNPGSLTGRIPAWHGPDFSELARDEDEIKQWILDGVAKRLRNQPLAMYFINRQIVHMPAYRGKIKDHELDELIAYIRWLRDPAAPGHVPSFGNMTDFFDEF